MQDSRKTTLAPVVCASCERRVFREPLCSACGQDPVLRGPEGAWWLERLLATGDFAHTWLATPISGGPEVAIKDLLLDPLGRKQRELVHREVRLLERIAHPQIPRFHTAFNTRRGRSDSLYIVQEYIAGETLEERASAGRLSCEQTLQVMEGLLAPLVYLHGLDPPVIHRDLKPQNIICRAGLSDVVIVDFGSARDRLEGSLGGSTLTGTFEYMAPEQFAGDATSATDLWAVGVVAVRLLSGMSPRRMRGRVLSDPLSWEHHVSAPAELRQLLGRLLEPDPARRLSDTSLACREVQRLRSRVAPRNTVFTSPSHDWDGLLRRARSTLGETVRQEWIGVVKELRSLSSAERQITLIADFMANHGDLRVSAAGQERMLALTVVEEARLARTMLEEGLVLEWSDVEECTERTSYPRTLKLWPPGWRETPRTELLTRPRPRLMPSRRRVWVKGVEFVFRLLPGGVFVMGSPVGEEGRGLDEEQYTVVISNPFEIAETTVTQAQWRAVMNRDRSRFRGEDRPAESVSWHDAIDFCNALSQICGLEDAYVQDRRHVQWRGPLASGFRLPTEAEWEYAARAGQGFVFAGSNELDEVAWHAGNARGLTRAVATRKPNAWGLFDMSGNVSEWVWDTYGTYPTTETIDPLGRASGPSRVLRGGSWYLDGRYCRVADRAWSNPSASFRIWGFRLARYHVGEPRAQESASEGTSSKPTAQEQK